MNSLLLIEDEEVILKALTRLLERHHFDVISCTSVEQALKLEPNSFNLILADIRLPGVAGTEIIRHAAPVPVVIMTSHASVRSAVNAMQLGAIDYISKPFDHDELILVLERSLKQNQLQSQNHALSHDVQRLVSHQAFEHCPSLRAQLVNLHQRIKEQKFIHLHGEPGSGREILARDIHNALSPNNEPLVVVDATTLDNSNPELSMLETGSSSMPNGYLRGANGGTLVIRYMEALSNDSQQRLFESVQRNPNNRAAPISDVRVISVGDFALEELVDSNKLDAQVAKLFDDTSFQIAPLRERPDDIESLSNHLLSRYNSFYQREGGNFTLDAMAALKSYAWPGNMNELRCVIERGVLVAGSLSVDAVDLGFGALEEASSLRTDQHLSLDEYFRYFVLRHQENLSETELASRLGISRKALWERRQKMQLQRGQNAPVPRSD